MGAPPSRPSGARRSYSPSRSRGSRRRLAHPPCAPVIRNRRDTIRNRRDHDEKSPRGIAEVNRFLSPVESRLFISAIHLVITSRARRTSMLPVYAGGCVFSKASSRLEYSVNVNSSHCCCAPTCDKLLRKARSSFAPTCDKPFREVGSVFARLRRVSRPFISAISAIFCLHVHLRLDEHRHVSRPFISAISAIFCLHVHLRLDEHRDVLAQHRQLDRLRRRADTVNHAVVRRAADAIDSDDHISDL